MVNKVVAGMDDYKVRIGREVFDVKAEDNLSARYRAAEQFKEQFELSCSLTDIVKYAKARLVTAPEPTSETEEVLEVLRRN